MSNYFSAKQIWTGQSICIQGKFTIDVALVADGCTFFMGPDAQIIVSKYVNFQAKNLTLFKACENQMWRGITVLASGSVRFDNSRVQDAYWGMYLSSDYAAKYCSITNCKFFNNKVGLELQGGVNSTFIFPFAGNIFSTDAPFLLPPIQSETAYSGIRLTNVASAILKKSSNNQFSAIQRGIESVLSNLTVDDGNFANIGTTNNEPMCYGIFSFLGFTKVSFSDFSGLPIGIYSAYDFKLDVQYCHFEYFYEFGVEGFLNNAAHVVISHNRFKNQHATSKAAIHVVRPALLISDPTVPNSISFDTILCQNTKQLPSDLIHIEAAQPAKGSLEISKNLIDNNSPFDAFAPINGIMINGFINAVPTVDGYSIKSNQINYLASGHPILQGGFGIALINTTGIGNRVSGNTVVSTLDKNFVDPANLIGEERSSWIKCSIHMANSKDWVFCRNNGDHVFRGNHFDGNLGHLDYEKNTMGESYYGMLCESTSGILQSDDQIDNKNVWQGPFAVNSAFFKDNPQQASFHFREDLAFWPSVPPTENHIPNSSSDNWFQPLSPGQIGLESCPPSGGFIPLAETLSPTEWEIVHGTYLASSPSIQWDQIRNTLLRMLTFTELRPAGSISEVYFQSHINSAVGQYAQAEKLYIDAFADATAMQNLFTGLFEQQNTLNKQFLNLDSLQSVQSVFDEQIFDDQEAVVAQLEIVQSAIRLQTDVLKLSIQTHLLPVESALNALPAGEIFESNWRTVFLKAAKKASGQTLAETDFQSLRAVANQCPKTGGEVVLKAAMFLPYSESKPYFIEGFQNSFCNPNLQEGSDRSFSKPFKLDDLIVIPNPSSDFITIFLPENQVFSQWQLVDMSGKIWQTGKIINPNDFSISIANMISGVYNFSLIAPTGERTNKRISIFR